VKIGVLRGVCNNFATSAALAEGCALLSASPIVATCCMFSLSDSITNVSQGMLILVLYRCRPTRRRPTRCRYHCPCCVHALLVPLKRTIFSFSRRLWLLARQRGRIPRQCRRNRSRYMDTTTESTTATTTTSAPATTTSSSVSL